jgi:hypothetical protein
LVASTKSYLAVFVVPGRIFPDFFAGATGAVPTVPGFCVNVVVIFPAPKGPTKGRAASGPDDAVRTAGSCVSSVLGKRMSVVSAEVSCVCDDIGGMLNSLTDASVPVCGARDVDACATKAEDRSEGCVDVQRAMESRGGNAIDEADEAFDEGVVAMSSNRFATPSEMYI